MSPRRPAAQRGMTLVEMLVATACTLILMAAIAQVFGAFGSAVSDSRSMIELDARLRATAWRLRGDLAGATARPVPPLEVEGGEGYLEIIEGPRSDSKDEQGALIPVESLVADIDDVLLFTTRSTTVPFLGRYSSNPAAANTTQAAESQLAEVAWFLRRTKVPQNTVLPVQTYTLFRRQNLIMGYVGFTPFYGNDNVNGNSVPWADFNSWQAFFERFDVSVRYPRPGRLVPNSLADLTRRESRFMHNFAGEIDAPLRSYRFPDGTGNPIFHWQADSPLSGLIFDDKPGLSRGGEDVVLTNVIGFDVRVFDPGAPVDVAAGSDSAVVPGEGNFSGANIKAFGAFVDLGWNAGPYGPVPPPRQPPRFADLGEARSGLRNAVGPRVWDSWSTHYESNGIDDDGDGTIDEGSNGLDDDGNGVADDDGELETLPPYRFPLRGIEIRIRCYEPSSRQVRQVTVRHSFVPR